MGRAGDAGRADVRGTVPVRGDCSDGNDVLEGALLLPTQLLLVEVVVTTLAVAGGAEGKLAYNDELGFNGCCDRAASGP